MQENAMMEAENKIASTRRSEARHYTYEQWILSVWKKYERQRRKRK
jgi:hypothetical protein